MRLFVLFAFVFSFVANAQTAATQDQKINDILEATGAAKTVREGVETYYRSTYQRLPNNPTVRKLVTPQWKMQAISEMMANYRRLYKETFSPAEIETLKAFYASAAGRKQASVLEKFQAWMTASSPIARTQAAINRSLIGQSSLNQAPQKAPGK